MTVQNSDKIPEKIQFDNKPNVKIHLSPLYITLGLLAIVQEEEKLTKLLTKDWAGLSVK